MSISTLNAESYHSSLHTASVCSKIQSLTGLSCLITVAKLVIGQTVFGGRGLANSRLWCQDPSPSNHTEVSKWWSYHRRSADSKCQCWVIYLSCPWRSRRLNTTADPQPTPTLHLHPLLSPLFVWLKHAQPCPTVCVFWNSEEVL